MRPKQCLIKRQIVVPYRLLRGSKPTVRYANFRTMLSAALLRSKNVDARHACLIHVTSPTSSGFCQFPDAGRS